MRWINGRQPENDPHVDDSDFPKQYFVRFFGDDPRSGCVDTGILTAQEIIDCDYPDYWEWLDESPTLIPKPEPITIKPAHIGAEDAEDFNLLEEYDMSAKLEKTIEHCLTKMPEENRKKVITNLCNGMIGSAILHFNNRYVKKLNVPDFKTTFK